MFGPFKRKKGSARMSADSGEGTAAQYDRYWSLTSDARYAEMGQAERAFTLVCDGYWVPPLDRLAAAEHEAGLVRGRHFTQWMDEVARLKREGRHSEALELVREIIEATEREQDVERAHVPERARLLGRPASELVVRETPPAWTEQAAIILRKLRDYEGEVAAIDRWIVRAGDPEKWVGAKHQTLLERREKAAALAVKSGGKT